MLQKARFLCGLLGFVALALAGCGSDGPDDATADQAETGSVASSDDGDDGQDDGQDDEQGGDDADSAQGDTDEDSSTGDSSTGDDAADDEASTELDAAPQRTDWLTFARGMTFVSLEGLQEGSANDALFAVNGDAKTYGVTTDDNTVSFVYELPAMTTLDRLAVPNIVDRPGNDTAIKFLTVEGSAEGPDDGWTVLADAEFELHDGPDQVTELELLAVTPIRWLRLTMSGGIVVEEGDEGKTITRFSELIGNGSQEPITQTADFGGRWEFDLTERPDFDGKPLEIVQTGSTITGCWGDVRFTGSANGVIARASGLDPTRNRPAAFIFVSDADDGRISALVSENGGFFKPYITTVNDEIEGCLGLEEAAPAVCDTSVYINFDVDSATIRPESEAVLADLYDLLGEDDAASVAIVGHTSTEGDAAYNLDLSQRRAQAVVDDLISRGFDADAIAAEGRGETEPLISPDETESAREINRRVDIVCG